MPGTVTVGCKLPHGFLMQVFKKEQRQVLLPGGGAYTAEISVPDPDRAPVRILGNAIPFGEQPDRMLVGGFAFTHDVDADLYADWARQMKDWAPLRNGLVVAHAKDTAGMAREGKDRKSGLERIDPGAPGEGLEPFVNA